MLIEFILKLNDDEKKDFQKMVELSLVMLYNYGEPKEVVENVEQLKFLRSIFINEETIFVIGNFLSSIQNGVKLSNSQIELWGKLQRIRLDYINKRQ